MKYGILLGLLGGVVSCSGADQGDETGETAQALTTCNVTNMATLRSCFSALSSYDSIAFTANVTCNETGPDACCSAGQSPLMHVHDLPNKLINGQGHTLKRSNNQRACSALKIGNAPNTIVTGLTIDEDATDPACGVNDVCADTIGVYAPATATFSQVKVLNSKANAIWIWGVQSFAFGNGTIDNAGRLGLYVGPMPNTPNVPMSRHIQITNSTFTNVATNALAIEGLSGTVMGDNSILGNTFRGNHRHGLWVECGSPKDICGGGQVFIGYADHLTFNSNTIADGFCDNCQLVTTGHHGVHGIELGYGPLHTPVTLHDLSFSQNTIRNNHAFGLFLDEGSTFGANVAFTNNTIVNNAATSWDATCDKNNPDPNPQCGLFSGVAWNGNVTPATPGREYGFETTPWSSALESGWTQWEWCGNGASSAVRWCPPSVVDPMDGSCVLRMMTSSAITNCAAHSGAQGLWVRSPMTAVPAGKTVYVDTYTRNGGVWNGKVCLVYSNAQSQYIGQNCVDQNLDTWLYNADPSITNVTPANTAFIEVRYLLQTPSGYADVDHTRISWL